VTQT
jgi:hypothetical protein